VDTRQQGALHSIGRASAGEIAVFEPGREAVNFVAESDAEFVLGSAVPHNHELVLGYYSVHTSPEALQKGEAEIARIGRRLRAEGRIR
jgi:trehalose utilization protein